ALRYRSTKRQRSGRACRRRTSMECAVTGSCHLHHQCSLYSFAERGRDTILQRLKTERYVAAPPVHEERRGGVYPARPSAVDLLAHTLQIQLVLHLRVVTL